MSVLFVSVQHSGNHSLFHAVGGRWARAFIDHRIDMNQERDSENFFRHTVPDEVSEIIELAGYFDHVLIPLRDPRAIAVSYYVRGLVGLADNWLAMTECWKGIPQARVVCVEAVNLPEIRAFISAYLGRPVHEVTGRPGSIGPYPEKTMYENGQHEALRLLIGDMYRDAEWLIANDPLASIYAEEVNSAA